MAQKQYLDYEGLDRYTDDVKAKFAPLDSPDLVGIPTAPTADTGTDTTQLATTAFVQQEISGITSALVFKGVVQTVAALPVIADQGVGWTYNIVQKGKTTEDFAEGAGKDLDPGSNVSVIEVSTSAYSPVTPLGTENPSEEGWYEYDDINDEYFLSVDTDVDGAKTYYEQVTITGKKWDILGGVFDVTELMNEINKRLEYGTEMPTGTVEEPLANGRTFLYLGDTTYTFNPVIGLVGNENPSALGYYEETLSGYIHTSDTEPEAVYRAWNDGLVTYFTRGASVSTDDPVYTISAGVVSDTGKVISAVGATSITVEDVEFNRDTSADEYIAEKTYYSRDEQYVQGVVYVYSTASSSWTPKTAGDTFVRITEAQIDALFE